MNSSPLNRTSSSQDNPIHVHHGHSFKERVLANMPQKLIALVCSLILFVVVISDRNLSIEFQQIPVSIRLPDGFVTTDGKTETNVNVSVRGRASLIKDINRDDLGVITLTPPARNGNIQVTLQPEMLSLPEGVNIEKFTPEFIGLNLESIEHRIVAVSTDHAFTGELLPGYQLGEVRIVPESIEISGQTSLISNTSQLYIEPIDLTGKASTFTVNRWIILNRTGIQANSQQVKVTVNIVSKSRQNVVLGVPIVPLNLSLKHEFVPPTIDLTLVGDEESLAKIDASKLFVTIDGAEDETKDSHARLLESGDFNVPNLPPGVGFDESKLPSVLLKVWRDSDNANNTETQPPKP